MSESRDAILKARYLQNGETEEEMWYRVAHYWANDEAEGDEFFEMMRTGRALPNTPAIANASKDGAMGSACFVLPVPDDTGGILDSLSAATFVHKFGGGTGFDFSRIRSKRDYVRSTDRPAPGPVEGPLKGFSEWLDRWSQAGMRNGANMGMLHIDHPDVMDFITAKHGTESTLSNFNLSVRVTDLFMRSQRGLPFSDTSPEWRAIVLGAWGNGEPGLFFDDTTNGRRLHPERLEATNPCGEVPLLPYEACVLGSVNLGAHLIARGGATFVDERDYRRTIATLVRFLDNIIERQFYPDPRIEQAQKNYRKIGVGVMGLADTLARLGVDYGSPRAVGASREWARILQLESYRASEALGLVRGPYAGHVAGLPERRNLCCNVVAPTGSISRLAACSFGIEPHFDTDDNGNYDSFVVGGQFRDWNPHHGTGGWRPASRVSLREHIDMTAAWQQHVDQGVSKTMNCPNETTPEEVSEALLYAWEAGLKGVTVLRYGSRDKVVIGAGDCVGNACAISEESIESTTVH